MPDQIQINNKYTPTYGDLTKLNSCRLILDTIGKDTLEEIARSYINLLETSGAIYEANGDYALGIFSSGWCQFLDSASRQLCDTNDDIEALKCGRWACHECCWNEASLQSIKTGKSTEIECTGGLHLYAVPISAHGQVVGSMNIGYGDPPTDSEALRKISKLYQVDKSKLAKLASEYITRPPEAIQAVKSQLVISAKLIGKIIEHQHTEDTLKETTHDLNERVKELNCLYGISKLVEKENTTIEEILQGTADIIPLSCQYPDITCANISYYGEEYQTENFYETNWKQKSNIYFNEKLVGSIMVCYLEERPEEDEGPFLKEERSLLDSIAERLGKVAEHYQAKEALLKAYDELEVRVKERTQELSIANEELGKSSEKITRFAYSIAHDLKNPAIAIYGLTKRLAKIPAITASDKSNLLCSQVVKSSEHIVGLVDKVNEFIASKTLSLHIELIDLKEVLQLVRDEFSTQLNIKKIKWHEPDTIPKIMADRISIIRVFRNFLDNAIKYGGENFSEIKVGYKHVADYHEFSFYNNGSTIKIEDCQEIFGVFKRKKRHVNIEGTGLGLSIVQELARKHKGKVWADADSYHGVTFYFSVINSLE
jgi:signal transduction histidine kinase/ligand-binding sensor protein